MGDPKQTVRHWFIVAGTLLPNRETQQMTPLRKGMRCELEEVTVTEIEQMDDTSLKCANVTEISSE